MRARPEALAWERRWALPAGLATLAAVALLIASFVVASSLGADGEAASLREIDEHGWDAMLASVLQGLGFVLLAAPLGYLFRAGLARSPRMRAQFLPLVVVAPLALAVLAVISGAAAKEAASDFVAGKSSPTLGVREATGDCRSERDDDPSGFREDFGSGSAALSRCVTMEREDDEATNAIEGASLRTPAEGLQIGGSLALAFALVYTSLFALRTGLLSRFWGSLGVALGVASLLGLFQFTLPWFVYLGLLIAGWVPGGRPPAWPTGEAIPPPTPGERVAREIEAEDSQERDETGQPR
jgi:hypothetical protein